MTLILITIGTIFGIISIILFWIAYKLSKADPNDWENREKYLAGVDTKTNTFVFKERIKAEAFNRIFNE